MLSEQQQRIMGYFIEEAKDHLNTIEQGLVNLQATIEDSEMVHEVFRAAHSVKGGAAMLGLTSIQHTAHRLEDYFKVLKECPQVRVDQKLETLFLRVYDTLHELVEQLQGPFGLTEDKAAEAMATVEPVFTDLNQHLNFLVDQAGGAPPEDVNLFAPVAVPVVPKPVVVPTAPPQPAVTEASALSFIFQNDVPARLRDMLQVFKQPETPETRTQLQDICRVLAQPGEQFDIPQWCDLLATARRAIGNPDTTYRVLAPVIIKDVKRAQELALSGRSNEIFACDELVRLLPPDEPVAEVTPDLDLADLFADMDQIGDSADLLAVSGEATVEIDEPVLGEPVLGEPDFAEALFADQGADQAAELVSLDEDAFNLFADESEETTSTSDDWFLDSFSDETDLGISLEEESEDAALDFALNFEDVASDATSAESELDNFDLIDRLEATTAEFVPEHNGPEVGAAELNSLADLFEGEMPDLGLTWQEEQVINVVQPNDTAFDAAGSNDFSDLLFDSDGTDDLVLDDTEDEDLSGLLDAAAIQATRQTVLEQTVPEESVPHQQSEAQADEWVESSELEISDLDLDLDPDLTLESENLADTSAEDDLDLFFFADEDEAKTSIAAHSDIGNTNGLQNLDALFAGIEVDELANDGANGDSAIDATDGTDDFDALFDLAASDTSTLDEPTLDEPDFGDSGLGDFGLDDFGLDNPGLGALDLNEDGLAENAAIEAEDANRVDQVVDTEEIDSLTADLFGADLFGADNATAEDAALTETNSFELDTWFDTDATEPVATEDESDNFDAFEQPLDLSAELSAEISEQDATTASDLWTDDKPEAPSPDGFSAVEFDLFQDSTILDLDSPLPEEEDSDFDDLLSAAELGVLDPLAVSPESDDDNLTSALLEEADLDGLFDTQDDGAIDAPSAEEEVNLGELFGNTLEEEAEEQPLSEFEAVLASEVDLDLLDAEEPESVTSLNLEDPDADADLFDLAGHSDDVDLVQVDLAQEQPELEAPASFASDSIEFSPEEITTELPEIRLEEAEFDPFDLGDTPDIAQPEGSDLPFLEMELPTTEGAAEGAAEDDFADLDAMLGEELAAEGGFAEDDFAEDGFAEELVFADNSADGLTNTSVTDFPELDDFADLEAMLAADTPPTPTVVPSATDDFADLEALLGDEAPAVVPVPVVPVAPVAKSAPKPAIAEDEFGDLEALLQDADQKLGGGSSPSRGATSAAARRPARRNVIADQTMRVSVKHLDNLNNLVGELVVNRNSLEQTQERLRQFLDNLLYQVQQLSDVGQRMRDLYERSLLESSLLSSRRSYHLPGSGHVSSSQSSHATGASFDALEMDRFTGFHTLSQSMIELIVRVRESASDIDFVVEESDQVTRNFRQITTQLQEGLTRSRMVPFAQTADRLPRGVRDNAIKYGKQAELTIEGRDTLIDKMIVEQLYDPMTHLVNNAIAHGIETPEERIASGKPPTGKITIRAFHQGNQTVISVSDDGAGINPERVKSKAVAKGVITAAEAEQMSRLDTYDLLFHHGFSTADQVDDLRGRGVGLDVVRNNLSEIRGVITIDSGIGKGTTFTIRLPLTLSISKALCCISNRARIAFPMDGVEDMLDVPKDRIMQDDQGRPCIQWRDALLPFQPLAELLKYSRILGRSSVYGGNQEEDMFSVVVLRSAGSYLALQVDQVLGEQEIVIKQLEGPVPKPVGVAGATVLGDGRIMPIADVLELIDLSQGRIRREANNALWETGGEQPPIESPTKTESTVLIVDDSITVRELLSMTFNKVGYRVEQARDGQEAWEKLRSGLPCDLVFCDIEMPRMDGLELLSRIQKDPHLNQIPIAMLTSRGADRHRQMAIQLGAKGYFTKPYLEEMLLDAAQRMLKGEVLVASSAVG